MGEKNIQRVKHALAAAGVDVRIETLPASARTAIEAADAIGCTVSEIAKSLVFRGRDSNRAVLAIVCGTNRLDARKLEALCGEAVDKADPDFVKAATGFAIGGVAPIGLAQDVTVYFDEDLLGFSMVWASAGGAQDVFAVAPRTLADISRAIPANLKE